MPRWSDWRATRAPGRPPGRLLVRRPGRGRRADREVGRVVVRVVPVGNPVRAATRCRGGGRGGRWMPLDEGVRRLAVADGVEDRPGRVADGEAAASRCERGGERLVGGV